MGRPYCRLFQFLEGLDYGPFAKPTFLLSASRLEFLSPYTRAGVRLGEVSDEQ